MYILKFIFLIAWTFVVVCIAFFVISRTVVKRKLMEAMNLSVGLYLSSVLLASGIILQKLLQVIGTVYETVQRDVQEAKLAVFLKLPSILTVVSLVILFFAIVISKFLSALFFGNRKDVVEFELDNRCYALVRGAMVISITLVLVQPMDPILEYFVPEITTPFYR